MYFYVITAVNQGGESPNSNEKQAKPVGKPPAPLGLAAGGGNGRVNLTWTAVTGADSYNVKISTTSGSGYSTTTTSTTNSASVLSLTNGTPYFFVVSAVNTAGEGPDSSEAGSTPIPPPSGVSATGGTSQVTVSWTASPGATNYDVRRSTTSGSGYASVGTTASTTFNNNSGTTNGTKYFYVVAALNGPGPGSQSTETSATPMAAPTGVTLTPKNGSIDVAWSPVTGATSYKVQVSTTSGTGYTLAGSPPASPFNVPGLTNGTSYFIVVSAVNVIGESVNSVELTAKPSALLYQYVQTESVTPAASTFTIVSDAAASGGQYIWRAGTTGRTALPSPAPTTGDVNYTVSVPAAGTYRLWARCMAAGTGNDSIYVRIDGTGVTMKNDDGTTTGITSGWAAWNDLGSAAPLGVGTNTWGWMRQRNNDAADAFVQFTATAAGTVNVRILYREPQLKVDRLLVTNDLTFTPSGTGP
jgi:fibronectin type 3 domain-containing protein